MSDPVITDLNNHLRRLDEQTPTDQQMIEKEIAEKNAALDVMECKTDEDKDMILDIFNHSIEERLRFRLFSPEITDSERYQLLSEMLGEVERQVHLYNAVKNNN